MVKLKSVLNDPKLWQVLTTSLLAYFGYVEVEKRQSQDVNIVMPEHEQHAHTHPQHTHKDWNSTIDDKIKKAIKEEHKAHNEAYH